MIAGLARTRLERQVRAGRPSRRPRRSSRDDARVTVLPTSLVGSYPQPDWLVDHAVLKAQTVPRVRLRQMWRVAEPYLEQAQDDATIVAIRDMERAAAHVVLTAGEA